MDYSEEAPAQSEFTLTHYGLPEPSQGQGGPLPNWAWLPRTCLAVLLAATLLGLALRRRK